MSVLTQCIHHSLYRVSHSGEKNLFSGLFIAETRGVLPIAWIAVEKGEHCDLFTDGLELRGNRVSHQAAKGPAEEAVRSDRLNFANKAQIIYNHILNTTREDFWLSKIARL
jgi:hypothetical protein